MAARRRCGAVGRGWVGDGMTGTVAVVVSSYNRPKMLRECLASIDDADQVIVADDGSDFDVCSIAAYIDFPPKTSIHLVKNPPRDADTRMTTPTCGALLNRALEAVECDYVLPALCDDDLLAPGFLQAAVAALDEHPEWHMVYGNWGLFDDGEQPDPTKLCTFTFDLPLTAGCWVERMTCFTEEGCWWREDSLAVHDGPRLSGYMRIHGYRSGKRPPWLGCLPILAGYRREHPKTISNNAMFGGDRYLPQIGELFAAGAGGME